MGGIAYFAHRWAYAVVALEVVVAAGCAYSGWRLLSAGTLAPQAAAIHVQRAAGVANAAPGPSLSLPLFGPTNPHPAPAAATPGSFAGLTLEGMAHLNADDYQLYRRQWQVLQLLMDGVRQYVEHRVVPQLLGH